MLCAASEAAYRHGKQRTTPLLYLEDAGRYVVVAVSDTGCGMSADTLAHLYEKAGKPAEARSFYQRVVSEFPDSPMRFEAQQRAAAL